jgi:alkylation response protein AidB-like acyl-CoA dehydrogenase
MDFTLSPEQLLLKDGVARFASQPRAARGDVWKTFAELGWLAVGAPEESGGFGGPVETLLLMEQLGRGNVVSPYVAQVVFAGAILRGAEQTNAIEELVEGRRRFAVAYEEPQARYDPSRVAASARRDGASWIVNGEKSRVLDAGTADTFIVSARTDRGVTLFAVPAHAAGIERDAYGAEDGYDVATIRFTEVRTDGDAAIGSEGDGLHLLELGIDSATAALCAEALGLCQTMLEATVSYTKQRYQFGVPLSSFQALSHRMAEMYVELELVRSMAYYAAMTLDEQRDAAERKRGISAAKAQIAKSGRFIGQQAIQLHGGIGMSEEYEVGQRLLGDRDYHVRRYAELRQASVSLEPLSV